MSTPMKVETTIAGHRWTLALVGPLRSEPGIWDRRNMSTAVEITLDGHPWHGRGFWAEDEHGGCLLTSTPGTRAHTDAEHHALDALSLILRLTRLTAWKLPPVIEKTVLFLRACGFDANAGANMADSPDGMPAPEHVSIWCREELVRDAADRLAKILFRVGASTINVIVRSSYDEEEQCGRLDAFGANDALITAWAKRP